MYKLLLISLAVFTIGCDNIKLDLSEKPKEEVKSVYSEDAKRIAATMAEVTEEDKKILYKQFSGMEQYLTNCKKPDLNSTLKIEVIIKKYHEDYEFKTNKYKSYDEEFKKFMLKYKTAKAIVDVVTDSNKEVSKNEIIADMKTLADAAKLSLETK